MGNNKPPRYCPTCHCNVTVAVCVICRTKTLAEPPNRKQWRKAAKEAENAFGLRELPAPPGIYEREDLSW